jgi:hypothetical protein
MKTKPSSMFQTRFMKSLTVLAVVAVLITSCKDDKEDGPSNNFTVEGSKKGLSFGMLAVDVDAATNNETGAVYYRHEIVLAGDGFELDMSGGDPDLKGQGDGIALAIVSATQELEVGTFNFTGTEENPTPFDFWDGNVYINYNTTTDETDAVYIFTSGKITVAKSGDIYTIDFEGTVHQAETEIDPQYGLTINGLDPSKSPVSIKGHFTGALPGYEQD